MNKKLKYIILMIIIVAISFVTYQYVIKVNPNQLPKFKLYPISLEEFNKTNRNYIPQKTKPIYLKKKYNSTYKHNYITDADVILSEKLMEFEFDSLFINPYNNNLPISNPIIKDNKLYILFENGKFAVYDLPDFIRNKELESKLNKMKFQELVLLDTKIIAKSYNQNYYWDNKWKLYTKEMPFEFYNPLFEDEQYLVYANDFGEWGANTFFYSKKSKLIYGLNDIASNTVYNYKDSYFIQSHLGHEGNSSSLIKVENIKQLPRIDIIDIDSNLVELYDYDKYSYDSLTNYEIYFSLSSYTTFSNFIYNKERYYILNFDRSEYVIAKMKDKYFEVVSFLPPQLLRYYGYNYTKQYGKYTLISYSSYLNDDSKSYLNWIKERRKENIYYRYNSFVVIYKNHFYCLYY